MESKPSPPALLQPCCRGIAVSVQRIKAAVALVLALVWLPAASCCLIDASGLLGKPDCCSGDHSKPVSVPGNCDKPCAALASATFLPQQAYPVVFAPDSVWLFTLNDSLPEIQRPAGANRDLPATAPPEVAGHWQFSFRTALAPRAPSFVS